MKPVTVSQLLKRMSRTELFALLGRETLTDSANSQSPDSGLRIVMLNFKPVLFEGQQAAVSAMLKDDTLITVAVSIPRRGMATIDDFTKLKSDIVREIGDPTAYTDTYIDYMMKGMQSVFGSFKDGKIKVDILTKLGS
ncbi:MAG: hypothetical protein Q8922_10550 [Bacteroidota bacterium]|nr:hypothetical protein [Bacteroidota bacterium]MDP4234558.1 hypothetical protein [Bacteroidota bacterium]MDP4243687.1 hypothetical protein [Bacteroidota bacterium]MDP4288365.1 hypothetical protein [Bacteroidota bacterium]